MLNPDDHVLGDVDAYLHDVLTVERRERLERHCETCRICQVALEIGRKRFDALQSLSVVEASDRLIRETERRIEQYRGPRWTPARIGLTLAAAAAVVIAGLHIHYSTMSPSPYDLKVLGQTELLAGSDASLRVLVVRHQDQSPVPGVPVDVELVQHNAGPFVKLASFQTDETGTARPRFRWPDWEPGEYELRVRARPSSQEESITRAIKLKRSWKLMVSSDKPVYQPGQAIHLRSLALRRPDLKPVAGNDVSFSIADPKGNVIFRQRGVTSRFGIASADCPLADEITEGAYQVTCQVGDTQSDLTVEVKRYVLPKFKIEVQFDKPYYQPGERVSGSVHANYHFGNPVVDAGVEVTADRTALQHAALPDLHARTDATGAAAFEFVLPQKLFGRPQDEVTRIVLSVSVRDRAGQEQTKSESCTVAAQPIHLEVIPEAGALVKGITNEVYLLATYADGRPAQVRITITGQHEEVATDEMGAAAIDFIPPTDVINWALRAVDSEGREGRREVTLRTGTGTNDFLVRTDKAVYTGGETLHLTALGAGNEPLFIDLIKDGQTMLTGVAEMQNGRSDSQIDLPADLFGTFEFCAYRYGADGLPYRKRRVVYIRQADELRIDVTQDRPEYRPGARAKLQFRLTDARGRPVPGAIGLAAVDEAVFSVLDRAPGMERQFFTLEQELLQPVLAAYPWSPEAFSGIRAARQSRFEQALFARTSETGNTDREAFLRKLLPYLDNDRRILDVLERPDWEQIASNMPWFPPELRDQLTGATGPHTLTASSFPDKARQIESQKRQGLALVKGLWTFFLIIAVIVLIVMAFRDFWAGIMLVAFLFVLSALLLPAVQQAREAAVRSQSRNDLKQLGMAYENAKQAKSDAPESTGPSGRLRHWFPETLLWRPELITDDNGQVSLEIDLADSITTWRLSASAVSANGNLGARQSPIRVFQPFFVDLNLPVALTRGDAVTVPVVVYNYLDGPQTVKLTLENAEAFDRLDGAEQTVELAAGEVKSVGYRLRARRIGKHSLRIAARAGEIGDTVERQIEIVSDGRRVEQIANGTLTEPARITTVVPEGAIDGSVRGNLKIYPSSFSQLVEGLDAVFQRPSGCFEQTSSTTYPNVLALDYLIRTKKNAPEVEAKAREYIHLGYQRLLSFEIPGGGFDWFGHPPANRVLSAYGLLEFRDMARVCNIDAAVIKRTRDWLLAQRKSDGSWEPESHLLHDDPTGGAGRSARLGTTAYIAWATYGGDAQGVASQAERTLDYLLSHDPAQIDDPYVLALVVNAITAIDRTGKASRPYQARIETLKRTSTDGKLVWWEGPRPARTLFYGGGISNQIETTALATLSLLKAGSHQPETVRGALAWLVEQKDPHGTWHSTQATVLALQALTAATGRPIAADHERQIDVVLDGRPARKIVIPREQSDVMQQIDLSALLGTGSHELRLADTSGSAVGYQFAFSYHTPEADRTPETPTLSVALQFERADVKVGESVRAVATVKNSGSESLPMVLVDVPIPAGFETDGSDFARLVAAGTIEKHQVTPRSVIVYVRSLGAGQTLTIAYSLRPTMPVEVLSPAAVAYEYYTPERLAVSGTSRLTVAAVK